MGLVFGMFWIVLVLLAHDPPSARTLDSSDRQNDNLESRLRPIHVSSMAFGEGMSIE